ncbi:MAG: hypothetical protein GWN58_62430, partial [Anaerolineae bacterium]|nr:hypothetical protein [Anaerolineae bacterium]
LCVMLEWNFYDVQRLVINEISARPAPTPLPANEAALEALQSVPVGKLPVRDGHPDTLGARLRQVREATGQTADIIA